MKKFILRMLVLAIIFAGAYTSLWYYKAGQIKKYIVTSFDSYSAALQKMSPESKLVHGDIKVTGFPLAVYAEIDTPGIIVKKGEVSYDIKLRDKFIVGFKLFSNNVSADLKGNVLVNISGNNFQQSSIVSYAKNPHFDLVFQNYSDVNKLIWNLDQVNGLSAILDNPGLKTITYEDGGSMVKNAEGKVFSSTASNLLKLGKSYPSREQTSWDFLLKTDDWKSEKVSETDTTNLSPEQQEKAAHMNTAYGYYYKLGKVDVNLAGSYTVANTTPKIAAGGKAPQATVAPSSLKIKNFSVDTDIFNFKTSGELNNAADEIVPYGELDFDITRAGALVEYLAGLYNQWNPGLEEKISPGQADKIKLLVLEIANVVTPENEGIKIIAKRSGSDSELVFGKMDYPVAMQKFNEILASPQPMPTIASPLGGIPAETPMMSSGGKPELSPAKSVNDPGITVMPRPEAQKQPEPSASTPPPPAPGKTVPALPAAAPAKPAN